MIEQDQLTEWQKLAEEARQAVIRLTQFDDAQMNLPRSVNVRINEAYMRIYEAKQSVTRKLATLR